MPATPGQRFCIYHPPATTRALATVLYVHPWAEEMNKSRRMAALQARALAAAGYAVLQVDLHGCGDSSDTWAEASWAGWVDDVVLAAQWLQARHEAPLWLWGLRAGCLLASQAAQRLPAACDFLFWQPAPAGKALLQQFLRLKAAADLRPGTEAPAAKGAVDRTRQALAAGQVQDVAGYPLAPALAAGLEQATLEPTGRGGRVVWIEVSPREDATLLPASAARVEAWRTAGHPVSTQVVPGPAFWQTQEIEDAPALVTASLAAMESRVPA